MAVGEGAVVLTVEVLAGVLVLVVASTMVPAHAGVNLQLLAVVVVQVRTQHLTGVQTTTVPPAGILFLVVEVAHQHKAHIIGKAATHAARGVAMLSTASNIEVGHIAAIHTFLNGEVEHGLLVAVLDTRDAGLVALLVVELHILDDAHRQVLQRRLHIAQHKLLTVDQNLLNGLAVDGDITVLIDFGTRHTLDELLDGRALWRAEGIGVINQRVFLHHHLSCTTCNYRFFQQHGVCRHHQRS